MVRDLIYVIPEWFSGFSHFLQFKSEFYNMARLLFLEALRESQWEGVLADKGSEAHRQLEGQPCLKFITQLGPGVSADTTHQSSPLTGNPGKPRVPG